MKTFIGFQDRQEFLEEEAMLQQEVGDLKLLFEAAVSHTERVPSEFLGRMNDAIRESERKFRLITETMPLPIVISRPSDAAILYANASAADFLKVPLNSLVNRKTTEFYDFREREVLLDVIENQGGIKGRELQIVDGLGNQLFGELFIEKIDFETETCLLVILRDITEQKIMEKQLRQFHKMEALGTLAGGIAHDFNNILTGIMGYADLIRTFSDKKECICTYVEKLLTGCTRAKELIHQILVFSRQTDQEFKNIPIRPIVEEAVKFLEASMPKTITFRGEIETDGHIMGDPTQIYQILLNLCTNAGDAMGKERGQLTVEVRDVVIHSRLSIQYPGLTSGEYIRLTVSDTGCGISPEIQKQIFDPFFSTKAPGKGTGLGLSVVHGIVKNHGGAIFVDSELQEGTAFNVFIPKAKAPKSEKESQAGKIPLTASEHILVVDDDQLTAQMTQEMLASMGFDVTLINRGKESLAAFRKNPDGYDLVIIDMSLPDMCTDSLSAELVKIRKDIPIIICTGSHLAQKEDIHKGGISAFLAKPFLRKDMAEAIRKALN